MKKKNSLRNKLHYHFDNLMSRGAGAMMILLGIMSLLIVFIAGFSLWSLRISPDGTQSINFIEWLWISVMYAIDTGNVAASEGWEFRIIGFFITLGGIFIISMLIGVVSAGIQTKLENLRKGRSFVIEKNHTVILGWSSKIFSIISELIIANENQRRPRIVVLANKDKVEMEDELKDQISDFKNTKVICRSGNPNNMKDVEIVNTASSSSIIVLSEDSENPDPQTIKTLLAVINNPERRKEPYHIVAEIMFQKNIEVGKMVGKNEVKLILSDNIIARIMAQTCRQSGLSVVYTELMGFAGDEIYFHEEPQLYGKSFGECLFAYEDSSVIGIVTTEGQCVLNPPTDHVMQNGEQLIFISEDDDTMILSGKSFEIDEEKIIQRTEKEQTTERILILGWNSRAKTIIREMDKYLMKGSYMKVVSALEECKETITEISKSLENIELHSYIADTTSRGVLDSIDITAFDSLIVLCYAGHMDANQADSKTLITLLHLRRICDESGKQIKIVSEMLNVENRDLAVVTKADDFIVSDKLISLLMSQISENQKLSEVFNELFDEEGCEIYLKPVTDFIEINDEVNFYTLLESAKQKNQIAIGYLIHSQFHMPKKGYGVVLNPDKSDQILFTEQDKLIVIAED